MKKRPPSLIILLLLAYPITAQSGAWTQNENEWLLVSTTNAYRSSQYFDESGKRQPQDTFTKYELNPYVEYGWSDSLTLGANLFLQYLQQDMSETIDFGQRGSLTYHYPSDNYGLSDSEFFARQRLMQSGNWVVSAQSLLKLPSLFAYARLPKGGSDSFDAEGSLLVGYGFEWSGQHHYLDGRIGYRHRTGSDLNDQYKADLKLGLSLTDSWQLIPAITTTFATDIAPKQPFAESGSNDYDLIRLECSLQYRLSDTDTISIGGFAHVDGQNTGEGYGLMVAAGTRF